MTAIRDALMDALTGTNGVPSDTALEIERELAARGMKIIKVAPAEAKLAEIRAELATLVADTQAELDRAATFMTTAGVLRVTPEHLSRMAMLSERLNLLDEVQRIAGQ